MKTPFALWLTLLLMALLLHGCGTVGEQAVQIDTASPPPTEPAWTPSEARRAAREEAQYATPQFLVDPNAAPVDEEVVTIGSRIGTSSRRLRRAAQAPRRPSSPPVVAKRWQVNASTDDEIWYIALADEDTHAATRADDAPGSGALLATRLGETPANDPPQPFPLEHTAVHAQVTGYISAVDVTQRFSNPFDVKIEAVYVFPLPEDSAITEFVMRIGERQIRGVLREKEEARRLYEEARNQGYQASLLSQRRPNVFQQQVGNIEPGKAIDIDIRYFHTLTYSDGWFNFVFPTTVGPRYNPPGTVDPLVAVSQGSPAPGATPYLRPEQRAGHDISITVDIDAGVALEEITSATHRVAVSPGARPGVARVALADDDALPNKDFILRYRPAGDSSQGHMFTHRPDGADHGYFTLMLMPPDGLDRLARAPMEMVFVIDCSGSMSGRPLAQATAAVEHALTKLQADDTFQIIRFSDSASSFGQVPVPVTPSNLRQARRYLKRLKADGGTQMLAGLQASLDFPHDVRRLRTVTFLTDGFIGNETDVLGRVQSSVGDSRVFSIGVGSAVNRHLMEGMARIGRGAAAYLGPTDMASQVMDIYFERVSHPAMANLQIDWGDMEVEHVYPSRLPDLFVGRPVIITGRYQGQLSPIRVTGTLDQGAGWLRIDPSINTQHHEAIAKVWARRRIEDLSDRQAAGPREQERLAAEILDTALRHNLVSHFTSFVAVDGSQRTAGSFGVSVPQPIMVPEGVRYETTVGSDAARALGAHR